MPDPLADGDPSRLGDGPFEMGVTADGGGASAAAAVVGAAAAAAPPGVICIVKQDESLVSKRQPTIFKALFFCISEICCIQTVFVFHRSNKVLIEDRMPIVCTYFKVIGSKESGFR